MVGPLGPEREPRSGEIAYLFRGRKRSSTETAHSREGRRFPRARLVDNVSPPTG